MTERERFNAWLRVMEPHAVAIVWADAHTPVAMVDVTESHPGWRLDYSSEWAAWQAALAGGKES